jgi:hypothetical protein
MTSSSSVCAFSSLGRNWLGRKTAPKPKVKNAAVETPKIVNETPAPQVQAVVEPAPTEATA